MQIPGFDLGGEGPPLHFLHANGFPPGCYRQFLERLRPNFHGFGMLLRPLWDFPTPRDLKDWHPLSADLLDFLDYQRTGPVVGVGHSIGGIVTLRAALRAPNRFRALVLIDPVLFVPSFMILWNLARAAGLGRWVHPKVRGALKRRRSFDDLDLVFRGYRNRAVFRYMSDESLRIYIEGLIKPAAAGPFELAYSPEWESHIYLTGLRDFDLWRGLKTLALPTLIIRGSETDTFLENAARLVRHNQPMVKIETLDRATHLLPLERPQEVFSMIHSFLKELS
jgi:pimeloyl-ACP methyl ester carboxylesterase